ncbi:E3 ubiquitin-protein ligase PRP19 [Lachancea thermotolerans CBS 6340]|uniref:Pre-mRNA-processing factor 19 n=1 Tax=Lachancea thermotolerans (strain ATCC 56472 / CBS 6340 / NRRL Y-8284) TaxID=559295 RepID=C5DHP0_LACTC|nr:KLTH0E05896p [Lachancea thermotolerans CBS 6340]CAR23301.1 KLTH0E05896p [Lachancea thermotolerans CBS 6340]
MFCAISGKPPKTASFSPSSKCVFEKSLIEAYVAENGIDPISKEPLQIDQLVEIAKAPEQYAMSNSVNSPSLNSNYSIPNLLSALQDEWDAVMLENFQLRQQIEASKKELSTALYRCDAAMNVAARATMEADKLKQELNILTTNLAPAKAQDTQLPSAEQGLVSELPRDLVAELGARSRNFAAESRKIKFSAPSCSEMTRASDVEPVNIPKGEARIAAAFIDGNIANGKLISFYNADGDCYVCSAASSWKGYQNVTFEGNALISYAAPLNAAEMIVGTQDGRHGIYDLNTEKISTAFHSNDESPVVFALGLQEVYGGSYIAINARGRILYVVPEERHVFDAEVDSFPTEFAHIHKDGLLIAQANSAQLIVRDLTNLHEKPIHYLHDVEKEGEITSARFASNGYWLIVSAQKALKVFDLRKTPNTLAADPILFENETLKAWDIEPSMKILFTVTEDANGTNLIRRYRFTKASKSWTLESSINCEDLLEVKEVHGLSYLWDQASGFLKVQNGNELITVRV